MSWIHATAKAQQRRVMRKPTSLSSNITKNKRDRKKCVQVIPRGGMHNVGVDDGIILHRAEFQQLVVQQSSVNIKPVAAVGMRKGRVGANDRGVKLPML